MGGKKKRGNSGKVCNSRELGTCGVLEFRRFSRFSLGLSLFASLPSSTEKRQSSGSAVVRDDEYGVFILDDGNVAPFDNHGP